MINRPQIKAEARHMIRTAAVSPLAVSAIVLLINFILERVSDLVKYGSIFYSFAYSNEYIDALLSGDPNSLTDLVSGSSAGGLFSPTTLFFSVLLSLFTIVLNGGYYAYCIGIRQGFQMSYSALLDGLSLSGKLIWCYIQMTVKTFLWSLLFVIPGFIALYRYRFAYYNLLTDPTLSASEAIQLSCRQTYGMKGSLFMLDLSFFGWFLLPSIVATFLSWMGLFLVGAAASIAMQVWVTPYITLCDLAYFEEGQRRVGRPPYGSNRPADSGMWI